MNPVIVWFRYDLRLADNPALTHALSTGAPVIPLYILEDNLDRPHGAASLWWLHHSLISLKKSLRALGSDLILRRGKAEDILSKLMAKTNASTIFWNRRYDATGISIDSEIKKRFPCQSFNSHLLVEPWEMATKQGDSYKVFTPFWKTFLTTKTVGDALKTPTQMPPVETESEDINSWNLCPTNWGGGFPWTPGEKGAHDKFTHFLEHALLDYKINRNRPDLPATSYLSPHLRWGEISVRMIFNAMRSYQTEAAANFLSEIGWREFSYHLLYHHPTLNKHPLRLQFANFPWREDEAALKAWQQGKTGYPIVDAGLRELWHTGYMHNRVRMIVASFLIKDLLIPWQKGESWFWDTLVDADPANNPASWQWVAGCGADAAPYFRIFNPVLQGEKYDPNGHYVRQWIPELKNLPDSIIHKPWMASTPLKTYPARIIDHDFARKRALESLGFIRN